VAAVIEAAAEAQKPARRSLPEHLPREEVVHPAPCTCPSCGGALRKIGADVTETLDYVPGRACDTVVQTPAPYHPIARGRAGAGLLAHIVVSKYDDHLPLYRQAEIYAREGVELETSTLSGWVGATAAALAPLTGMLTADVIASETLTRPNVSPNCCPGTGNSLTPSHWLPETARTRLISICRITGCRITGSRHCVEAQPPVLPERLPPKRGTPCCSRLICRRQRNNRRPLTSMNGDKCLGRCKRMEKRWPRGPRAISALF
jgi:transposase